MAQTGAAADAEENSALRDVCEAMVSAAAARNVEQVRTLLSSVFEIAELQEVTPAMRTVLVDAVRPCTDLLASQPPSFALVKELDGCWAQVASLAARGGDNNISRVAAEAMEAHGNAFYARAEKDPKSDENGFLMAADLFGRAGKLLAAHDGLRGTGEIVDAARARKLALVRRRVSALMQCVGRYKPDAHGERSVREMVDDIMKYCREAMMLLAHAECEARSWGVPQETSAALLADMDYLLVQFLASPAVHERVVERQLFLLSKLSAANGVDDMTGLMRAIERTADAVYQHGEEKDKKLAYAFLSLLTKTLRENKSLNFPKDFVDGVVKKVGKLSSQKPIDLPPPVSETLRNRKTLADMRAQMVLPEGDPYMKLLSTPTSLFSDLTEGFVQQLFRSCLAALGATTAEYAVLSLGSLARGEMCPYSDLEFAILLAGKKGDDIMAHMRAVVALMELKVIALGETPLAEPQTAGFRYDEGGNVPFSIKELCGTVNDLVKNIALNPNQNYMPVDTIAANVIQGSKYMFGSKTVADELVDAMKQAWENDEYRRAFGISQLDTFLADFPPKPLEDNATIRVKEDILRLPVLAIGALCTFHGVFETSTLRRVDALVTRSALSRNVGDVFKEYINYGVQLRTVAHLHYRAEEDDVSLGQVPTQKDGKLNIDGALDPLQGLDALRELHAGVLMPFHQQLITFRSLVGRKKNIENAFRDIMPYMGAGTYFVRRTRAAKHHCLWDQAVFNGGLAVTLCSGVEEDEAGNRIRTQTEGGLALRVANVRRTETLGSSDIHSESAANADASAAEATGVAVGEESAAALIAAKAKRVSMDAQAVAAAAEALSNEPSGMPPVHTDAADSTTKPATTGEGALTEPNHALPAVPGNEANGNATPTTATANGAASTAAADKPSEKDLLSNLAPKNALFSGANKATNLDSPGTGGRNSGRPVPIVVSHDENIIREARQLHASSRAMRALDKTQTNILLNLCGVVNQFVESAAKQAAQAEADALELAHMQQDAPPRTPNAAAAAAAAAQAAMEKAAAAASPSTPVATLAAADAATAGTPTSNGSSTPVVAEGSASPAVSQPPLQQQESAGATTVATGAFTDFSVGENSPNAPAAPRAPVTAAQMDELARAIAEVLQQVGQSREANKLNMGVAPPVDMTRLNKALHVVIGRTLPEGPHQNEGGNHHISPTLWRTSHLLVKLLQAIGYAEARTMYRRAYLAGHGKLRHVIHAEATALEDPLRRRDILAELDSLPSPSGDRQVLKEQDRAWKRMIREITLDKDSREPGEIVLMDTLIGKRRLHPDIVAKMFDDKTGRVKSGVAYGRRNVVNVDFQDHSLHFKEFPELPGMEYAVSSLLRRISGVSGAPASVLVKFTRYRNGTAPGAAGAADIDVFPVLISRTVKGQNLDRLLREQARIIKQNEEREPGEEAPPVPVIKIDRKSFTLAVFASLLVSPEDAKADNHIAEPISDEEGASVRIVCVDNDHAFVPPVIKTFLSNQLMVKSIVYCMDDMRLLLDHEAVEEFLTLEPDQLLKDWLEDLHTRDQSNCSMFTEKERMDAGQKYGAQAPVIPISIKDGTIDFMYQTLSQMRRVLRAENNITHLELLERVQPLLAKAYGAELTKDRSAVQRFEALSKDQYEVTVGTNTLTTKIGTQQLLKSALQKVPDLHAINKRQIFTPAQALQELMQVQRQQETLDVCRHNLLGGRKVEFDELKCDDFREQVINGNESKNTLGIEFGALSPEVQVFVLTAMKRQSTWNDLRLLGCTALTEKLLKPLLSNQLVNADFSYCAELGDSAITTVAANCPKLRKLSACYLPELKKVKGTFPELRFFDLDGCRKLQGLGIVAPKLELLFLRQCPNITLEQLANVCKFAPALTKITLNGSGKASVTVGGGGGGAGASAAEDMSPIPDAHVFEVCPQILAYGVPKPANFRTELGRLVTDKNMVHMIYANMGDMIDDNAACQIAKAFLIQQCLTELDLSSCRIGRAGVETLGIMLQANKSLRRLCLANNSIGEGLSKFAEGLTVNRELRELDISNNQQVTTQGIQDVCRAFPNDSKIQKLLFAADKRWFAGGQAGLAVADLLRRVSCIDTIDLAGHKLGANGAAALTAALQTHATACRVSRLVLSKNEFGDTGVQYVSHLLPDNPSLTDLDLSDNEIGSKGVESLCLPLTQNVNTVLTALNISWNRIGDKGAMHVADMLRSNTTLQIIKLSGNDIHTAGEHIAAALKNNKSLTECSLSGNRIADAGATAMGDALRSNTALRTLDWSGNSIGVAGARQIARALIDNRCLTNLDLSENAIDSDGSDFLEALALNPVLVDLNVKLCSFNDAVMKKIDQQLKLRKEAAAASVQS